MMVIKNKIKMKNNFRDEKCQQKIRDILEYSNSHRFYDFDRCFFHDFAYNHLHRFFCDIRWDTYYHIM